MAEQGLRSVVGKKYNHHANHGNVPEDKANILKRDFRTETINQKWCTDITYIHVEELKKAAKPFHFFLSKVLT